MIIDFHRSGTELVADLYLDQDGDGAVSYSLRDDNQIEVRERMPGITPRSTNPTFWTFRVTAPDGWWERDGKINYNLNIQVDGAVAATLLRDVYIHVIKTDGVIDFVVHVRDTDHDGRPDYEWREAFLPFGDLDAYYRTSILVNTEDDELPVTGSIFWPYLGNNYNDIVKPYNQSPPPFEMNWQHARIDYLGEFVASRANPGSYFVYTFERLKPGEILEANHENPFGFYNLAGVDDGYPDLAIRFEDYHAADPYFIQGTFDEPIVEIEYTWDQDHLRQPDKSWSYMVGLVGRHKIDSVVELPDLKMRTVPYDQAPTWVTEHNWDAGTFVAVEQPPLWTSEHIYTWTVFRTVSGDLRNNYITGEMTEEPTKNYQDIDPGLRGEYNFNLAGRPLLYFSSIDRKLHLLTAQYGVWRINESTAVRYGNLSGGDYIDSWQLFEGERLARQLYAAPKFLVYGDDQQVRVKAVDYQAELFRTLPPRTHDEWASLGAQLRNAQRDFAPGDLGALVDQFSGSETQLSGASMRNYRQDGKNSFRFVLELQPGFKVQGEDLLGVQNLLPGTYVVNYNGAFHLERATPPAISATLANVTLSKLQPTALRIGLHNAGSEDLSGAILELQATSPQGYVTTVTTQTISLPAQTTITTTVQWAAQDVGEWTLKPLLRLNNGEINLLDTIQVQVGSTSIYDPFTLMKISMVDANFLFIILILVTLSGVTALVCWTQIGFKRS